MATLGTEDPIIIGGKKKPNKNKKKQVKKDDLTTAPGETNADGSITTEQQPSQEQKENNTQQNQDEEGDDEPAGPGGEGADAKKKKKKKKKKAPEEKEEKKSAVGRLAAEALKRRREEEERLRKEEEERFKQEEEERIRQEEEEARLEEIRLKKKEIKKQKQKEAEIERKKKEEEDRRQRIIESLGSKVPAGNNNQNNNQTPQQKKKPIYTNKKKKFPQAKQNAEQSQNNKQETSNNLTESEEKDNDVTPTEEPSHDHPQETNGEHQEKPAEIEPAPEETPQPPKEEEDDWETNWEDEIDEEKKKARELEEKRKQEEKKKQLEEKRRKERAEKERKETEERERKEKEEKERKEKEELERAEEAKPKEIRSPICCILGHVDTGKTKLLDKIRRTNVQEGEAGGITQQIGATYFPFETIREQTAKLQGRFQLEVKVPGLLIIDTPGHESFTNLRSRGSSLCDIAILVVDIMHGLEPQTIESINLLRKRNTPFVVALNKIDRLYSWKSTPGAPVHEALKNQSKDVLMEYEGRVKRTVTNLAEQGLNACLYYENTDFRKNVSLVPTSAITGEGIPDLLMLVVELTQKLMNKRLVYLSSLQCTVLEVKVTEGFGTTIDVVLVNGVLHEGDEIVLAGLSGPIRTTIRAILTPQPLKELRIKGQYVHHKEVKAALGLKIAAPELNDAVAGSSLYVVGPDDDVEQIMNEAQSEIDSILKSTDKSGIGVYVQASTLGSLEALLEFLKESKIPVSQIGLGPLHKKHVISASVMLERKHPEYALILAFDIKITKDAQELADDMGVRIFSADIIYHLFDQFTAHMKGIKEEAQNKSEAVFPCILEILPESIFNKRSPIIVGVHVVEGTLRIKTPIAVVLADKVLELGRVASLEYNNKPIEVAKKGDDLAVRIDPKPGEQIYMYGRHFDHKNQLCSRITRESLDAIKQHFAQQVTPEDVALLAQLKKSLKID